MRKGVEAVILWRIKGWKQGTVLAEMDQRILLLLSLEMFSNRTLSSPTASAEDVKTKMRGEKDHEKKFQAWKLLHVAQTTGKDYLGIGDLAHWLSTDLLSSPASSLPNGEEAVLRPLVPAAGLHGPSCGSNAQWIEVFLNLRRLVAIPAVSPDLLLTIDMPRQQYQGAGYQLQRKRVPT